MGLDSSQIDLNRERSTKSEAIRRDMHEAIKSEDISNVQKCLEAAPTLRLWLDPNTDKSALYAAIKSKAFPIYSLLLSQKCHFKDKESECCTDLDRIESAEIRRQQFFATKYENSYIHYIKSKSRSQTFCGDFSARLDALLEKLDSIPLVSTILKVVATAPHLEIVFDYESQNVERIVRRCSRYVSVTTAFQKEIVYIGSWREEDKLLGTFAHELCHMALYLVYRNDGKPYRRDDTKTRDTYQAILSDIEQRQTELNSEIKSAFIQDKEEELVVRVPHVLAQYGSGGEIILNKDAPKLFRFFEDSLIPDMTTYISDRCPGKDAENILIENARQGKAFPTGQLKVTFDKPLKYGDLGSAPLHVLTGPDLRFLEIIAHDAVSSTGQLYLFFETNKWDDHLMDVLLDNKCAILLVTASQNGNDEERNSEKDILESLSLLSSVVGTKVIFLLEGRNETEFLKEVRNYWSFAKNHNVKNLPEASSEHVTRQCKEWIFHCSNIGVQGGDQVPVSQALDIDSFLRFIDANATTFLELCKSKRTDLGPPPHALEERISNYYVERLCARGVKLDFSRYSTNDEQEILVFVGCSEERALKILPRGYRIHSIDVLQQCGPLSHLPFIVPVDHTSGYLLGTEEKVVVICGDPGMGKSVLASRLSTKIRSQRSYLWVLFINLSETARLFNFKTTVDDLKQFALLCGVKQDEFEFPIFERSLNIGSPFEVVLIFDAFDEVDKLSRERVLQLVKFLTGTKVYKIFLFSRTVFKCDIEDALHTVSYQLVPFSDEDTKKFRDHYKEDRTMTANEQQQRFRNSFSCLSSRDAKILRTPLFLRMVAEIETGNISEREFSMLLRDVHFTSGLVYTVDIYKMFVEYRYLTYRKEKKKEDVTLQAVQQDDIPTRRLFYKNHGVLAVSATFPESLKKCILDSEELESSRPGGSLMQEVAENRLMQGLVNGIVGGIPEFTHEMFSEFLAANFLLERASKDKVLLKTVFDLYAISTYKNVMEFFDGLAAKSSRIHSAVMNQDASFLEHTRREDMHIVDELRRTPLHLASLYADKRTLEMLPIDDALITKDVFDMTPFMYAHKLDAWDRLEVFCDRCNVVVKKWARAIISNCETQGLKKTLIESLLLNAVRCDLPVLLQMLLKYFYPKNSAGTLGRVRHLLGGPLQNFLGRSVELHRIWDLDTVRDRHDRTVLFYAQSSAACEELVRYCDVGLVDDRGNTMLHVSAENGNVQAVEFHLPHSSLAAGNKVGDTPLHLGSEKGHAHVVQFLFPTYSSVNLPNYGRYTPFHMGAEHGHLDVVKLLLLRSSTSASQFEGLTALHCASAFGHLNVVEFLIPHSSANNLSHYEETAFLNATCWSSVDVALSLLPHSHVYVHDKVVRTALLWSAKTGNWKLLQVLYPYSALAREDVRTQLCQFTHKFQGEPCKSNQETQLCLKHFILNSDSTELSTVVQTVTAVQRCISFNRSLVKE